MTETGHALLMGAILPVPKAPILQLHDTTDTNRLRRQTLRYLRVPFGSTILSCLT